MNSRTRKRVMERKIVERLRLGNGVNKITRELGTSKKRVIKIRRLAERKGYLDILEPLPSYPAILFPELDQREACRSEPDERLQLHREWIEERLDAGWDPITVFEELPIVVSRSSFYRFLNRHGLRGRGKHRRVIPEIISQPGETLQLDWGKLCTVEEDGRKRTVWMLTGVLGFSRYLLVRLVWSNTIEETLEALKSMFEELGGVPLKVTTDNPKCFALKADRYEPLLNPAIERFSSHYNTVIECLPPRAPQKKGKVERQIGYVRRLYQAHGENWFDIDEAQEYMDRKLELANRRKHGTTGQRPADVFISTEQPALKALPVLPYQIEEYHCGKVRKDGHVRFRTKYYSVNERHINQEVVVLGTKTLVSIFHEGALIEVHPRITDPNRSKSTKKHHLKPWEQTLEDQSLLRKRAQKLGPAVDTMVFRILHRGMGFIDFRKIWGILNLDKKYSSESINQACALALEQDRIGYRAVKEALELLELETRQHCLAQPGTTLRHQSAKFIRPMVEYQQKIQLRLIEGGKK